MNIKVMKYAVNYDKVVNFVYDKEDFVTKKLIDYYQNYVIRIIPKDTYKIKNLDLIINKYISDVYFYNYIQNSLENYDDFYYDLDIKIIKLYKKYQENEKRKIATGKWL